MNVLFCLDATVQMPYRPILSFTQENSLKMFKTISTERLLLRQLVQEDAEAIFQYRTKKEIQKFQSWGTKSEAELRSSIAKLSKQNCQMSGWYQIGIALSESGILIGDCGIHTLECDSRLAEVGITINPDFQRNGYASEALKAVLAFLFEKLKKHRVSASVDPNNVASLNLMRAVGMRKEGHFVESTWFNENWVDDVIFSLLEKEWLSKNS